MKRGMAIAGGVVLTVAVFGTWAADRWGHSVVPKDTIADRRKPAASAASTGSGPDSQWRPSDAGA